MVGDDTPTGGHGTPIDLIIDASEAGERLDRVLAARNLGHSRSTLQRWMNEGRVLMDERPVVVRAKAVAGSVVRIAPAPPPPTEAEPEPMPLAILFEDEHLLVLDKPAGLVVHPAPGHARGTLVNGLLHHYASTVGPKAADNLVGQRPGIVHRLDKDTSGVMVVAKSPIAHERLVRTFTAHDLERRYLAIAVGSPADVVTFDTLHGRHPVDRKRFSSKVRRGRRAVTHVRVLERLYGAALVECRLETGRTHQIRVHLSEHGSPLVGDPLYGHRPRDPRLREVAGALGRQALHAELLAFQHPITEQPLSFSTALPPDFQRALTALRAYAT